MLNNTSIVTIFLLALMGVLVYLLVLVIKALRRYIVSNPIRQEKVASAISLGEAIKEHRMSRNMTQEFVAESLGVSRQAVSKWESGASDPSTTNLIALAKLLGVKVEDLLKETK